MPWNDGEHGRSPRMRRAQASTGCRYSASSTQRRALAGRSAFQHIPQIRISARQSCESLCDRPPTASRSAHCARQRAARAALGLRRVRARRCCRLLRCRAPSATSVEKTLRKRSDVFAFSCVPNESSFCSTKFTRIPVALLVHYFGRKRSEKSESTVFGQRN